MSHIAAGMLPEDRDARMPVPSMPLLQLHRLKMISLRARDRGQCRRQYPPTAAKPNFHGPSALVSADLALASHLQCTHVSPLSEQQAHGLDTQCSVHGLHNGIEKLIILKHVMMDGRPLACIQNPDEERLRCNMAWQGASFPCACGVSHFGGERGHVTALRTGWPSR